MQIKGGDFMATDKPRFSVTFTEDSFSRIQKYQKDNQISTQSKAVARLVELAINSIDEPELEKNTPLYSSEALKLAQDYDSLDEFGKKAVCAVADVEKARCANQAQVASSASKLYIAARDGSRMEAEVGDDFILPEENATIP